MLQQDRSGTAALAADSDVKASRSADKLESSQRPTRTYPKQLSLKLVLQLEKSGGVSMDAGNFPASMRSAVVDPHGREASTGIQYFSKGQDACVVGAPERHMAADLQVG